jgi:cell division protein FtsB
MDFRLGTQFKVRILPKSKEGLHAVVSHASQQAENHVQKAEAAAVWCVERTRPQWTWLVQEWRRLGTAAAVVLIAGLLLHAMYGANGMVIYRQKRAEMQALQTEVDRLQQENNRFADQIRSLKSDPAAIEKEAREQLRYTRPGEFVLVAPEAPRKPPIGRAKNDPGK